VRTESEKKKKSERERERVFNYGMPHASYNVLAQ